MKYLFEKYYPYAVSLVIAALIVFFKENIKNFNQIFDQITTNALSVSGTLVGFFLTILTIINTITTRRMKFIKDSGSYPTLLHYLNVTIIWHLLVISVCLFLPLIRQIDLFKTVSYYGKVTIIFTVLVSWLLGVRFTYIFIQLLHDPTPPQKENLVPVD